MIIDKQLELSLDQAITATAVSTNVVDQGVVGEAIPSLKFFVKTGGTAFTTGTSMTVDLQTATDESFTSPVVLFSSGAILTAALTANKVIVDAPIPVGALRFLRANYTVAGSNMGAGSKVTAELVMTTDLQLSAT